MAARQEFTTEEARRVGEEIGVDWSSAPFDVEQFRRGMDVELEHGLHDLLTNVTEDDPVVTGKIALAHLNEFPDYYTRLERMEKEAKQEGGRSRSTTEPASGGSCDRSRRHARLSAADVRLRARAAAQASGRPRRRGACAARASEGPASPSTIG